MSDKLTNGGSRYQTEKVRVAIIGVGNCASSFVQGVQYYKDADPRERVKIDPLPRWPSEVELGADFRKASRQSCRG